MAYQAIPPATTAASGTMSVAYNRARSLLGTTITKVMGSEFDNDQWYRTVLTSGTVTPSTTDVGGVITLTTTATLNRIAEVLPHGTIDLVGNPRTDLWYFVHRSLFSTGVDANAVIDGRMCTAAIGAPSAIFGAIGSVSTTNFSYLVQNDAGTITASGGTTVALDTSYHLFETWNNGTNISFALDGVVLITTPSTNIGTNSVTPMLNVGNGATNAARTMKSDYLWVCTAAPAT